MSTGCLFRFGPFELDPAKRLLTRGSVAIALGPKVVDTLTVLADNAGALVTKSEIMDRVWPDGCVEEANLTQNVYRLRRVLSSAGFAAAIETVACRGYRFTLPVERIACTTRSTGAGAAPEKAPAQWRHLALISGAVAACGMLLLAPSLTRAHPPAAYDRLSTDSQRLYTLGRYQWNLRSDTIRVHESLRYFEDVVRRDPANPLGYSGLADAYMSVFDADCDSTVTYCHRVEALATENARKAVDLDPDSAEAHTSLAMAIYEFSGQDGRAETEFRRAIALDPSYALAHHWYGNFLLVRGFVDQAAEQQKEALALEPASPATYAWLASTAYFSHRYRDAIAYAQESLALYPRRHATVALLGLAYEQLGNSQAAIATFAQLPDAERKALAAALYARNGERSRALAMLREIGPKEAFASGCTLQIALAWSALGDRDRAYEFMKATPAPNRIEHNFYAFDPRLDALRSDSRFDQWTAPE